MFSWSLFYLLCIIMTGCIYLFFLFDKAFPEPARLPSEPQEIKIRISWETKWNPSPDPVEVETTKRRPVKNKKTKTKTPKIILSFEAERKKNAKNQGLNMNP